MLHHDCDVRRYAATSGSASAMALGSVDPSDRNSAPMGLGTKYDGTNHACTRQIMRS